MNSDASNMESLRCIDINKNFDAIRAIDNVRIDFPTSGISAIIGSNGAGKTTLLNILTGFLRPDVGRCFLGQREITGLPPYRIARLGIARSFQDLRLISHIAVLDNVLLACPNQRGETLLGALLPLGIRKEEARSREAAQRILVSVGLENEGGKLGEELSYGQQKLLTLACCLASEAHTLLLDEPVAGVHPEMAALIVDLLGHLRDQGKRIIFIEHDIMAVRQLADYVIVMDEGRIIAQGSPREVLERPEIMEAYLG